VDPAARHGVTDPVKNESIVRLWLRSTTEERLEDHCWLINQCYQRASGCRFHFVSELLSVSFQLHPRRDKELPIIGDSFRVGREGSSPPLDGSVTLTPESKSAAH
jgi:hypothetical protein